MSLDDIEPAPRTSRVEWPTVALITAIYGLFLGLTWFHDAVPVWLWLGLAAWTSAWWGSAQHEILHGHPTRSRALNQALGTPPLWLWLPFERYRATHLQHHHDERLTDPLDDPESRYVTPEAWARMGVLHRAMVRSQGVLLGRLILGPLWVIPIWLIGEARAIRAGDRALVRIWAWHLISVALILVWIVAVCGVPIGQYLLGFVYGGTALALIRSFCEHRAHDAVGWRTAVVERSRVFGLLFLFNNLHVVHHRWPAVPWYRLPGLYARHRKAVLAHNGGLVYRGYGDVFRRYLLTPHDAPVHPRGRVPGDQAGNG